MKMITLPGMWKEFNHCFRESPKKNKKNLRTQQDLIQTKEQKSDQTVLKQNQWTQMSKARGKLFFIKNYLHEFICI